MRAQKTIGQGLVFAEQSEQQMFGLNVRRTELAGLVPRKEDDAPGFFRVAFKHILNAPLSSCEGRACGPALPLPEPHYAINRQTSQSISLSHLTVPPRRALGRRRKVRRNGGDHAVRVPRAATT